MVLCILLEHSLKSATVLFLSCLGSLWRPLKCQIVSNSGVLILQKNAMAILMRPLFARLVENGAPSHVLALLLKLGVLQARPLFGGHPPLGPHRGPTKMHNLYIVSGL